MIANPPAGRSRRSLWQPASRSTKGAHRWFPRISARQRGRRSAILLAASLGCVFVPLSHGEEGRASANPFLFQGARYDAETGFYYFRNRYYDPHDGRFLQRDPVWDGQEISLGTNPFAIDSDGDGWSDEAEILTGSNPVNPGGFRGGDPVVAGDGALDVGLPSGSSSASAGRMRIDALDRSGVAMTFRPIQTATFGVAMVAIPNPLPRLDLVEAAGTAIAEGEANPVSITLPFGSDPTRSVTVRARDFNALVPISIVLTPEHGPSSSLDAVIDNQAGNPAQVAVDVTFPVGVPTNVAVWTR